jgi:hypothetical protein
MWIYTEDFFCDVIREEEHVLYIKFRSQKHAKNFCDRFLDKDYEQIKVICGLDYRCYIRMNSQYISDIISGMIMNISYSDLQTQVDSLRKDADEHSTMAKIRSALVNYQQAKLCSK